MNNVVNLFGDDCTKYSVVMADPPWHLKMRSEKGYGKSADKHYPTMSIEEIANYPVSYRCAKDCALFMWVTWPLLVSYMKDGQNPITHIIRSWGFEPSGLAWEWGKFNHQTGKWAFGGGYGTRKNFEPCILARRGNPVLKTHSETDRILARRREHSRKPDEQYAKIGRMFDGPKIELFARQAWPGWAAEGNQVGKFTPMFQVAA